MCGDLSPVLNNRVNNCQTRGLDKGVVWRQREREPGQAAGWPASALWPAPQWERGRMILVIPLHPSCSHRHTPIDPSAPCDKPFVINRVLIMPTEHRMCPIVLAVTLLQLNWLDVTERYVVYYRRRKNSGFILQAYKLYIQF